MDLSTLAAFAAAFFLFAAGPGPDNMTIVARTVSHGVASGFAYGLGTTAGVLVFLVLGSLSLSMLAVQMSAMMAVLRRVSRVAGGAMIGAGVAIVAAR